MDRRHGLRLVFAAAVLAASTVPTPAAEVTVTWRDTQVGRWFDSTKWTPAQVPNNNTTTTYTAVVGSGAATLDADATVQKFTMFANSNAQFYEPKLLGNFTLTVNDLFTWNRGTLGGGTLTANGGMSINVPAATFVSNARTINNAGVALWNGSRNSILNYRTDADDVQGTINNLEGATWNATGDSSMDGGIFNNFGTFLKTGGDTDGQTSIGSRFNHAANALVEVRIQTLNFTGGGTGDGRFSILAGARLGLGGKTAADPYVLSTTSIVSGAGDVSFASAGGAKVSGTYDISGRTQVSSAVEFTPQANLVKLGNLEVYTPARLTFATGSPRTLAGVLLTGNGNDQGSIGGPDDLNINGAFNWIGGAFNGPGRITLNGNSTCDSHSDVSSGTIVDTSVDNNGQFLMTGGFRLSGATFNNLAGATFEAAIEDNQRYNRIAPVSSSAAPSSFNNAGTFVQNGREAAVLQVPFTNSGTVAIKKGTLVFANGFTSARNVTVDEFTSVEFGTTTVSPQNVTHTLGSGSSLSGAGTVRFVFGSANVSGSFTPRGDTFVHDDASVNFLDGAQVVLASGRLDVARLGRVRFDTGHTDLLNDLNVDGLVTGSDRLVVHGKLTGTGTVDNPIVNQGRLSPGNSPGALLFNDDLALDSTSEAVFELAGRNREAAQYDFVQVDGVATLGGTLSVAFIQGFSASVVEGDHFTILTSASSLAGGFDNVASGQRLLTTDGSGSFIVQYGTASPYGAENLVLSDFRPGAVPEPAGGAVLSLLSTVFLRRRK